MKNKLSLLLVSFFLFSCAENKQLTEQQTTFCNPMNLDYGWGCFQKREKKARTAADPVIVLFKDDNGYRRLSCIRRLDYMEGCLF